jgi:hypothetical protein
VSSSPGPSERSLPGIDLTSVCLPTPEQVRARLTDLAYISIGFGLLTFQRAQVRRREVTRQFERAVGRR